MILDTKVWVSLSGNNIKYYESLGYHIPRQQTKDGHKNRMVVNRGTQILVDVNDLQKGTKTEVHAQCDYCGDTFTRQYYLIVKGRSNGIDKDACDACRCKKSGENRKIKFSTVIQEFASKEYELLTTENELKSLVSDKLRFLCPIHGEQTITWNSFYSKGAGCKDCGNEKISTKLKEHTWERIKNAFDNSEYELLSDFDSYTNATDRCLKCLCKKHGEFYVSWANFQRYCGCPTCNSSMGERSIKHYLDEYRIQYDKPKRFDGLVGVGGKPLSYDFYLPDYDLLIEYQGIQHEEPRDFGKLSEDEAYKNFLKQQEHDLRKRNYAKNNGYSLLEIWYYDFYNIADILAKKLTIQN